jgi:hypothetical protein
MKKIMLLSAFFISIIFTLQLQAQNWQQIAKTLPTPYIQGQGYVGYGNTVAIDGNYAVVGASGYKFGAAFVLYFNGSSWINVATLTAPLFSNGGFGSSVSISGDYIVVGVPGYYNYGSAYVFTKPISGWTDMSASAILIPSDPESGMQFGCSVSISGMILWLEPAMITIMVQRIYLPNLLQDGMA